MSPKDQLRPALHAVEPLTTIETLHEQIRTCRLCVADGFPISPPPLVFGEAPAPFMLIGQAPGISDLRGGRMYLGPAARKLIGWLKEAGFQDSDIGTTLYMTALTKCFPGRLPGKSTDRAPSAKECANCRPWLRAQLELVKPQVLILFGKMAIDLYLKGKPLTATIGRVFHAGNLIILPLPHSSGASTWLNHEENRALVTEAIAQLSQIRSQVLENAR